MAEDFDRYVIVMHTKLNGEVAAKHLQKIHARLGSLVAPVFGEDGTYVFGCVSDMMAEEISEVVAAAGFKVAVFSIGKDYALPGGMGGKFAEIMIQHPVWKSKRHDDW